MAKPRKKPGHDDDDDDKEHPIPEQAGSKGEAPGEYGGPGWNDDTTAADAEQAQRDRDAGEEILEAGPGGDRLEANRAGSTGPAALDEATGAQVKGTRATEAGESEFDKAMAEAKARKAAAGDGEGAVTGTLYSADETGIVLMTENKEAGRSFEVSDGCKVTMIDTETTLEDLKRGDRVKLVGDPVTEVEAFR